MTEPSQVESFVVDAQVEELEPRDASAISGNPAMGDDVTLIGPVTIYYLL
jgi:hypothetical protein